MRVRVSRRAWRFDNGNQRIDVRVEIPENCAESLLIGFNRRHQPVAERDAEFGHLAAQLQLLRFQRARRSSIDML
jgi:hypothetical protein